MNIDINDLPDPVKKRLEGTFSEIDKISEEALAIQKTKLTGSISFTFKHSAPTDILTPFERAQSVCFITKYEHLPLLKNLDIFEHQGNYYLKNIHDIRYILNEYRVIVMNKNDSVYFSKIHTFCYEKLKNRDNKTGLSITVEHDKDGDITETFIRMLGERNRSIKTILKRCEFDYIYNGILQHSDHEYTKRFWDEYSSGKLNHVFLKHAFLLGNIKEFLFWHYKILNALTFPKLGPI